MAYFTLTCDVVPDYLERRIPLRAAHLALVQAAHQRGEIVLAGALEPADATLLIWSVESLDPIERFLSADPYVQNGLVTGHRIRKWNVVVGG